MTSQMKETAFVFPGQGSQSPGMLDAWQGHPAVTQTLQEASDALGEDLAALIADGSAEQLALTTNTQPVMLTAAVAAWRVWRAEGGALPATMAGHSLGEYSALVAAEALPLHQAVPLARLRAQAMQDAVPVGAGAMAAIVGLASDLVVAGCAETQASLGEGEVVEAVNFNDPKQTVIAGTQAAVERACEVLKGHGARRALILPVSAPFHSSLMAPAAERLRDALTQIDWATPVVAVLNNVDVAAERTPEQIQDALYRQAFHPVRWVETILTMRDMGVGTVVECGPGKVLSGMIKRIAPDLNAANLYDLTSLQDVQTLLG